MTPGSDGRFGGLGAILCFRWDVVEVKVSRGAEGGQEEGAVPHASPAERGRARLARR